MAAPASAADRHHQLLDAAQELEVRLTAAQADQLLAALPAQATASQRRHLAAVFLATRDQASALVQWLRLPVAD